MENADLRVVGIYRGVNPMEDVTAVVALSDLQAIMERPAQVTEFQLMLDEPLSDQQVHALCGQIEELTGAGGERWGLAAIAAPQYVGGSNEAKLADALAWATTALAMLIGCVAVWNTMHVSVLERTREIGVLRAIGWQRRRVVWMIFCESELIVLTGAAAGILLGIGAVPLLARLPAVRGLLRADVAPSVVVVAALLATAVGLVASAIPSFCTMRCSAVDAMRRDEI